VINPDVAAKFAVRKMCAADLDQVMAIAAGLKDAPHWPQSAYIAALHAGFSPRRIALVFADAQSDSVAGFAVAILLPPQAELESIGVRSHEQRKGIGSKLIGRLVHELRLAAVSELMLEVRASNLAGIAFYQALGWSQSGVRPRYYADPEEDAILMSLSLG
jgi:[ribosomal protein S18]-alanine N-acetyltransferase